MSEPVTGISREDVAHLAGLARIDLSETELDHLATQLPAILDHVASIADHVGDDVEPMSHPVPVDNVFRPDEVRPSLSSADALAGAPASDQQRFLVPKILGED